MQLVLQHPDNGPLEATQDVVVVVACESPATAPQACALLQRVGRNANGEGRLIYSWWTFGVLASAPLRQLASRETAAADILMVAAKEGPELPEGVSEWVRLWLANSAGCHRPRALVALLEPDKEQNGGSNGVLSELKQLAKRGGVDFLANGDAVGWEPALLLGPVPQSGNSSSCAGKCSTQIAGRNQGVTAEVG